MPRPGPEIHSLTCHRDLAIAIPCPRSLIQATGCTLVLHEDGSLGPADVDRLRESLPGVRLVLRQATEAAVLERLAPYPACRRYRSQHPLSNKLLDIPLSLGSETSLRFCDGDVLFFKRVIGLFPEDRHRAVFCEEDDDGYSAAPWKLRLKFGFRLVSGLNSGLFQFPLARLDLEFLEWFLGHPELLAIPGLAEQTAWALLLREAWPQVFARDQIFCSTRRPLAVDSRLTALHFLYHLKPRVHDFVSSAGESLVANDPVTVEFRPPSALSVARILRRRLFRRWRSRLN